MANAKSNYLRSAIINHVLRNTALTSPVTVYVALFTVAPTAAGGGTEVPTGASAYTRMAVTFEAGVTAGVGQNDGAVTFPVAGTSWGTIVAMAIFDAATAGNMLYFGNLTASKTVGSGDQVSFADNALVITET
jgi:hypothetical protein